MTNFDDNVSSFSSSPTRDQEPQGFTVNGRLIPFSLRPIRTHANGNRSISPAPRRRTVHWNVATDDRTTSADEKDDTLTFNPIDLDHVLLCIVKCHACNFNIEVPLRCGLSEEFDANYVICPVCNEKLGEDAIRTGEFKLCNYEFARLVCSESGKKPDLRENKHERMSGSALSQTQDNLDGQSFNDFSSDEDDMTDASDDTAAKGISIAKSLGGADAPNTTGSNEQDVEERSERAAFAQNMFMSALFSE